MNINSFFYAGLSIQPQCRKKYSINHTVAKSFLQEITSWPYETLWQKK